jgi:Tol biopolymer transport system component
LAPGLLTRSFSWAPSGEEIAYISTNPDRTTTVASMSIDGTEGRTLITGHWSEVDWSPDGTRLMLVGEPAVDPPQDFISDLYVLQVDDPSDLTALTSDPLEEWYATWSPDGSTIAAMRSRASASPIDIITVPADGGPVTVLTDGQGFDAIPEWSPDGQWIAFSSDRDATPEQQATNEQTRNYANASLYVMRSDGSNVRLVYRTDVIAFPTSWTANAFAPLLTPVPTVSPLPPASVAPGPGGYSSATQTATAVERSPEPSPAG